MKKQKKAVVLISGGLDSTTTLAFVHSQGFACYALSFEYGQKHQAELNAARRVAKTYHAIEHRIVKLNFGELSESALTTADIEVPDYSSSKEIPATYVPARNTVFLAIALGWAESLGANDIFIGASSIDYSGYPDCRPEYFNAFQNMANFATKTGVEGNPIQIHAPLLYLSKAATIQKGTALGVDYSLTFSCYNPDQNDRACKRCASCTLRRKGFEEAGVPDPTLYQ